MNRWQKVCAVPLCVLMMVGYFPLIAFASNLQPQSAPSETDAPPLLEGGVASLSIVAGVGYSYDTASRTLTITDSSVVNWRSDANIGLTNVETAILPTTPTSLAGDFFRGCTALTRVENLDKVTTFSGSNTFRGCTNLREVTLPMGAQLVSSMFRDCASLEVVNNLDSVVSFAGTRTFSDCVSLVEVTLPVGVPLVGLMFYGCSGLATLNNLDTIDTFLGDYTFVFCTSLTSISLAGISGTTTLPDQMFFGCESLEAAYLPAGIKFSPGMFAYCTSLTTVQNVESALLFETDTVTPPPEGPIGTFEGCTSLTEITLPSVPFSDFMFYESGLRTVTLSPGAVLPQRMFRSCTNLTTINGLDQLAAFAEASVFKNCTSLVEISLPPNINVGSSAFEGCTSLTTINGLSDVSGFEGDRSFAGCVSLEAVSLPANAQLSEGLFEGCSRLETLHHIESATSFGDSSLKGCALDFSDTTGYPAVLTANLASIASDQLPKVYFSRVGASSATITAGTAFVPSYSLRTKTGSDFEQLVANKALYSSWLNQSVASPVVTSTPYDVNVPGVYNLIQSLPANTFANVVELAPFVLTVQGVPVCPPVVEPPVFKEGAAPTLVAPTIDDSQSPLMAQGWQVKRTSDIDYVDYVPGTVMDASYEGALLRYFATNALGTIYSPNVITIHLLPNLPDVPSDPTENPPSTTPDASDTSQAQKLNTDRATGLLASTKDPWCFASGAALVGAALGCAGIILARINKRRKA